MKAIQIVIFFFLFNAFLYIFTTLGIYSMAVSAPGTWVDVSGSQNLGASIAGAVGIGSGVAIIVGIASYYLAGTTGLQSISISVLLGFFVGLFYNTYQVLQTISDNLGAFSFVLNLFLILTGTMFIISVIWGIAQMGIGGARSYD